MSKKKRLVNKILNGLRESAPLNNNRGPLIKEFTISHSHKDRKRKGHVEARLVNPMMKWNDARNEGIEPIKYYDAWNEPHDGFRYNTNPDQLYHRWRARGIRKEKIYTQNNKLRKLIRIREAKLQKHKFIYNL
jgi:hypothetical protein